jgi:hypothetical protein
VIVIDGEELNEGVDGLGRKLRVVETGAGEKVGERAKGGFDL